MRYTDKVNACGNHPGTTCAAEIVKLFEAIFPGTVDVTDEHIDEDDYAPQGEKGQAA